MEFKERVGEIIRTDRKAMGLSPAQLAEKLGIGVATLHRIESGKSSPSLDLLLEIAKLFHRPMVTFFQKGDKNVTHIKSEEIEVIETDKNYFSKVISPYGLIHPKIHISYIKAKAEATYNTHQEEGYQLIYLLKGKLLIDYGGKIHAINEGDTFFCKGINPHLFKTLANSEYLDIIIKEKGGTFIKSGGLIPGKKDIREIIRADRKAIGLSLKDLAEKLGIGVATLHRIESGKSSPSLDLLLKIALEIHRPVVTFFQKGDENVDHRKSEEIEVIETEKNYFIKVISPYGLIHPEIVIWHATVKAGTYNPRQTGRYEWVYLLKGKLIFFDEEGKIYAINEGDVFLCNGRNPHVVKIIENSELIYLCKTI